MIMISLGLLDVYKLKLHVCLRHKKVLFSLKFCISMMPDLLKPLVKKKNINWFSEKPSKLC